MIDQQQDVLIRAMTSLRALRSNIATLGRVEQKYVLEFHAVLSKLNGIGIDINEFRIPDSEVGRRVTSTDWTGGKSYSSEQYVDKAFILVKLDAIVSYLDQLSSAGSKLVADTPQITSARSQGSDLGPDICDMSYDVFLSYSAADEEPAHALYLCLIERGFRVYFAKKSLKAGDNFSEGIRQALIQSTELWVLITPSSLKSEWVTTEWGAGWALGKRIVPILLRCSSDQIPQRLRSLHCADYHEFESLITQLTDRLKRRGKAPNKSL